MSNPEYDLLVVGGGPAGSTTALAAAKQGLSVALVEKEQHPRFHIGESFLPRNLDLLKDLDLTEELEAVPHVTKLGASFALGHEEGVTDYHFRNRLGDDSFTAFNVERAPFDEMLCRAAVDAGAELLSRHLVTRIRKLEDHDVAIEATDSDSQPRLLTGRYLVDASGQSTLVGRHLGTRRTLRDLRKVAYFGHFRGVDRRSGELAGYPIVVMCREGWFWVIPIDADRTSIGLVVDRDVCPRAGVAPTEMLAWGIQRTPIMKRLTTSAEHPSENLVTADFSYICKPYSGPGYFLVGDAATFVDPIFSTGVCLGMMSAVEATACVAHILAGRRSPGSARRAYNRLVRTSSTPFFRLVRQYYRHPFRELFLEGEGPLQVHRAVVSVLSGHVFPRPRLALRSRMVLMRLLTRIQSLIPLAPRRSEFSLLDGVQ